MSQVLPSYSKAEFSEMINAWLTKRMALNTDIFKITSILFLFGSAYAYPCTTKSREIDLIIIQEARSTMSISYFTSNIPLIATRNIRISHPRCAAYLKWRFFYSHQRKITAAEVDHS